MIKKNSICKLIKNVKTLITSDEFRTKHSLEDNAFTRNRKLSFQDIISFILGLPRKSLPTELDLFFEEKDFSVSKQAFSKARYKISSQAFEDIFQMSTDIFQFTSHPKTWDGYRIFAIDGSDIAVAHNKKNETEFGLKKNNHSSYPMARLTALYDVTNDLIVDVQFTGISIGEREHAHRLLSSGTLANDRNYKNLIIFDRGYPSRALIHELEDKGLSYLIRCSHSFLSCVNGCPDGDHTVTDIYKGRTTQIRVIKDTSGEEPHILVSNLFDELNTEPDKTEISIRLSDKKNDIVELLSYAIGCIFGRYSLVKDGVIYAGGVWDSSQYGEYTPDFDNVIPITDEEYFEDDIVGKICEWVKFVFGENGLEENLEYIAMALNTKGDSPRASIRSYFMNDFIADHIKMYQKKPIYWLFDSGKENGFKVLVYMHRYTPDTVGIIRTDYLHKTQKAIEQAMQRAEYTSENASSASDKKKAVQQITKYTKQLAQMKSYDEAMAHIANQRIEIDLDDGVKVNYEKFQGVEVAQEGKKALKIDLLTKIK